MVTDGLFVLDLSDVEHFSFHANLFTFCSLIKTLSWGYSMIKLKYRSLKRSNMRKQSKTKTEDIINYWSPILNESELNLDLDELDCRCWRCGQEKKLEKLQRCHIVADSLGGSDEPSNFVLLCAKCHQESPDVDDPKYIWIWIKSYRVEVRDLFWVYEALKEYEHIFKTRFEEDLSEKVNRKPEIIEELDVNKLAKSMIYKATLHLGTGMSRATLACVLRMMLSEI